MDSQPSGLCPLGIWAILRQLLERFRFLIRQPCTSIYDFECPHCQSLARIGAVLSLDNFWGCSPLGFGQLLDSSRKSGDPLFGSPARTSMLLNAHTVKVWPRCAVLSLGPRQQSSCRYGSRLKSIYRLQYTWYSEVYFSYFGII